MPLADTGDWNETARNYGIPEGTEVGIRVGASSTDIRLHDKIKL